MHGHVEPQWNIQDYVNLRYNQDTVDDTYLNNFLDAGHNRNQMCLYNYFEPQVMPVSIDYVKSKFNFLSNLTAAINLVLPGQYMPLHRDLYARWRHIHKVADTDKIMRIVVMLEDNEQGQFLQIANDTYNIWKAGDWFSWTSDAEHAIYNFSTKNRYAIQLTGLIL